MMPDSPSPYSPQSPSSPLPIIFPLRWESTCEEWWYATPIDYAAANGYYDIVRSLLQTDPNLLIKLTSLRRIQRLETVWDPDNNKNFHHVAKCRAQVARNLLHECDNIITTTTTLNNNNNNKKKANNSLMRAGYGGWILYTAAYAGEIEFVNEILERDSVLVFGEGEFGITELLYAAARSGCEQVFEILMKTAIGMKCDDVVGMFESEIMCRGLHGLARSGNLQLLKQYLMKLEDYDVLGYRDGQGASILHAAAAKGQVEVVKYLIDNFPGIIDSVDEQGNTPLHTAAYRGYSNVIQTLLTDSPTTEEEQTSLSLSSQKNNHGDTFLHVAVTGFQTPTFHRIDFQLNLIKQILQQLSNFQIHNLINLQNNQGKTPLHLAVSIQSQHAAEIVVDLLMSVETINLNLCDRDGLTPLDLLRQRKGGTGIGMVRKLVMNGGVSSANEKLYGENWRVTRSTPLDSGIRLRGEFVVGGVGESNVVSPGTSFRLPDSEIFFYEDDDDDDVSCYYYSDGDDYRSTPPPCSTMGGGGGGGEYDLNRDGIKSNSATKRLKEMLKFRSRKKREIDDDDEYESSSQLMVRLFEQTTTMIETPTPLRERFTKGTTRSTSLANNKRVIPIDYPSPIQTTTHVKKKFSDTLVSSPATPTADLWETSSTVSGTSSVLSSPGGTTTTTLFGGGRPVYGSNKSSSLTPKGMSKMNRYLCFGAKGLTVVDRL